MEKEKLIYADSAKMVVEYIEQHLVTSDSEFIQGYLAGIKEMANGLAKMPPVDAAPVVQGRWDMATDGDGVVCSVCGTDFCILLNETDGFKYCPNCGANMMGGGKDDGNE